MKGALQIFGGLNKRAGRTDVQTQNNSFYA